MVKDPPPKLTRFEILGAWLNVWTPPRDARVPPIPWRTIGLWTPVVLVALGVGLAVAIPLIDEAKTESAAIEQRGIDERRAVRVDRIRREQTPRTGRIAAAQNRGAAVGAVEGAIGADARRRFDPRARQASCEVAPGSDAGAGRVPYDCFTVVREIEGAGEQEGARGALAIPYRAVLDFEARRYAFCKVNPPPGEQILPDPREIVKLPRACRA